MASTNNKIQPHKRRKITYVPKNELPEVGFIRKPTFLALLGISSTTFHDGIRSGKIPPGKLLTPRCRVWSAQEVRDFISSLEKEEVSA